MFTYVRKAGTTDVSVVLRVIDSTDGTPEAAFAYNTSGIDLVYRREGATVTDITEATLAGADAAHSDGGVIYLHDGYIRVDLPDAACAAGVTGVLVSGSATGMVIIGCYIQLVAYDPFDTVRLGLTALPNAAANAAGGLPISAGGALALDTKLAATNEVTAARMGALTDLINGGRLDLLIDAIKAKTDSLAFTVANQIDANVIDWKGAAAPAMTGDAYARLGAPAGASVSADVAAVKAQTAAIETDTQDIQTKVGTPAGASLAADIAAIEAQTDDIGAAGAGLTAIPWNAAWDTEVQSEATDALNAYDPPTKAELDTAQGAVTVAALGAGVINVASIDTDVGSTALATNPIALAAAKGAWDAATADYDTAGTFGEDAQAHALSTEIAALNDLSSADVSAAILAAVVEGTITIKQAQSLMLAVLTGKSSGGGTNTIVFRDTADSKNRISATVDADGNRTAIGTRDGT